MRTLITQWAAQLGIPPQAVQALFAQMTAAALPPAGTAHTAFSEARIVQERRLAAAQAGGVLWRNNVGAAKDEYGNYFRYGLCNDSKQMNERLKSSDLIGITPVTITLGHVGTVIGQFTAEECKEGPWKYTGTPREKAQLAFIELVGNMGGKAKFTNGS